MVHNMCMCYLHRNPPPLPLQRSFSDSSTYKLMIIKKENIKLGETLDQGEFESVLRGVYTDIKGKKVCDISTSEIRTPH